MTARRPFACIVPDPPWAFGDKLPGHGRGAAKHYPVLTIADIEAFPLPPIADDAYLFLWRVASQVEEANRVVRAWGFVPKSEIVWVKQTSRGNRWFGMGRTVRAEHEVAIVAKRGHPDVLSRSVRSTFEAPVPARGHSAKPEEFFDLVEALVAGPRLELFARRKRPGWTCMGNEIDTTPTRKPMSFRPPPTIGTTEYSLPPRGYTEEEPTMKGLDEIKTDNKPAPKKRRKQAELPGLERQSAHPEVEEAAKNYVEVRDERMGLTKREKSAKLLLIATMHAHKVLRYEYPDENGDMVTTEIQSGEENVLVRKTGESEAEIGQGTADVPADASNGKVRGGLIDQALRAQAAAGVEENADGDVVPPEKSAKKLRGRKGKAK